MKKIVVLLPVLLFCCSGLMKSLAQDDNKSTTPRAVQSQTPFLTPEEKRDQRKNLVVKEMNTDAKGNRQ